MADISKYLSEILAATYGEEVRESIYNAIDLINKVGEATLTLGTAVTSVNSPSGKYYKNSVYINTNTWDLWRCNGTGAGWTKEENLLGANFSSVAKTGTKTGTNDLVDIYTVKTDNGASVGEIEVTNGTRLEGSKTNRKLTLTLYQADGTNKAYELNDGQKLGSGTAVTATNSSVSGYYNQDLYLNMSTWDIWRCNNDSGNSWTKLGSLKGIKSVKRTAQNGLVDTYTITAFDDSVLGTFTVTNSKPLEVTKTGNTVKITSTDIDGTTKDTTLTDSNKIGIGTSVTGTNSSTTLDGTTYYANDIYINNSTWVIWRCTGSAWENKGVLKSIKSVTKTKTEGYTDTYTIKLDNGDNVGTFEVSNGKSMRFYQGDIPSNSKVGTTSTCDKSKIYPSDDIRIGDILLAQWDTRNNEREYAAYSVVLEFWQITAISGSTVSVTGLGEYPIEAGTDVSVSRKDNKVTITTSDASGKSSEDVVDGNKIVIDSYQVPSENNPVINGVTFYDRDVYIYTVNWNMYCYSSESGWVYKGNIRGAAGSTLRAYVGTTTLDGTSATIKFDDITPSGNTYSVQLGDLIVAQNTPSDTSEISSTIDIWRVNGITYPSQTINITKVSSANVKTGLKGNTGTSIDNVSLVTKNERVATYRVNLDNGMSAGTFEVTDGAKGDKGDTGYAPIVTVSKSGIVTTIKITDVNGEKTATIKDGESGDGSGDMLKSVYDADDDGLIDLTALPMATDSDLRDAIDAVR